MPRYLLLIAEEEPATPPSDAAMAAVFGEYDEFTKWLNAQGWNKGGEALQDSSTATTVRLRDGHAIVTDGPFAETKEQLGGYYIVDVATIDDAVEAAARIPGARTGYVEVREIVEFD